MFVLASMAAASVSGPIRIRNMSPSGALIEGEPLPRIGEQLNLRRANLSVSGRVVWRETRKAGLLFDQEIRVADWLPVASGKQMDVDRAVQELKAGAVAPGPRTSIEPTPLRRSDLLDVAAALDVLADALAEDGMVVARHASRLQVLDIASQVLRKLAAPGRRTRS
jgi:hypothetical protein